MGKPWSMMSPADKEAARVYRHAWRQKNHDRELAQRAAIRASNPEKHREDCARWRRNNPEKARAIVAKWKSSNAEKLAEIGKASKARSKLANPEKVREQIRAAGARKFAKDPEKHRAILRASYVRRADKVKAGYDKRRAENPEIVLLQKRSASHKRRAAKAGSTGSYSAADVQSKLTAQDGVCYYCRVSIVNGYEIDHMIPLSRGGSNGPENIALACKTCNRRKHAKTAEQFMRAA